MLWWWRWCAVAVALTAGLPLCTTGQGCAFQPDVDYQRGQPSLKEIEGLTQEECCRACANHSGCVTAVFSAAYDTPPRACYLKAAATAPSLKAGVVACWPAGHGPIPPPPPPPALGPTYGTQCYNATLVRLDRDPVVSFVAGSSAFQQVFNPSWVSASTGTSGKAGLLIRTQNCSAAPGSPCVHCSGTGARASRLTFAELLGGDNSSSPTAPAPRFRTVDNSSVVFGPHNASDARGTEDPRIAYDPQTSTYLMMYTCYAADHTAQLCLASSRNPTSPAGWTRHGHVFSDLTTSKSGALHIRGPGEGPHLLYWGAGEIRITNSSSLLEWTTPGRLFITETAFGNPLVEAGPPPLRLSTGDWLFFHNSWNADFPSPPGYEPTWVVLDGRDPTRIVAWAQAPLWRPDREPWMEGVAPWTCNVRNVAFLEAAHPAGEPDLFRVYFGGSDAVVGSALVRIAATGSPCRS